MGNLTVFTKPACVQCNATYRALDNAGLSYSSVDMTVDPTALDRMKALGFLQAPVVIRTDDEGNVIDSWSGFNPGKVEEMKAEKAAAEAAAAESQLVSV